MVKRGSGQLRLIITMIGMLATAGCAVLPNDTASAPADQAIYTGFKARPRVRYGTYATANFGTPFIGRKMGSHGYAWPLGEKNGIAYTCQGGHIDITHVRIAIDWCAYLTAESYRHLMNGDPEFTYKMAVDRSRHYVQITYPPTWDSLSEQERSGVARDLAFAMGPYLTFTAVTWHEILTWHGYKCIGLPVEYASAFSWEDSYSNLLGVVIAARVLQDTEHSYNEAVRIVMEEELDKLGIQRAKDAKRASASVQGEWYTGGFGFFVNMKKRNFDIGLQNGYVTPTLVPDAPGCPAAEPLPLPVPTLEVLAKHGVSIVHEIEPHEWEKDKILGIVHDDKRHKRINPQRHFGQIMRHIREEATARYGPEYDPDRNDQSAQYVYTAE